MLVNIIQNTISSFRSALAAAEVITTNLKMWLGFETSETLGREEVVNGDFSDGTNNWNLVNATLELNGAKIENIGQGSANAFAQQILPYDTSILLGKSFELTYDVTATNGKILGLEQLTTLSLNTATTGVNRKLNFIWTKNSNALIIKRTVDDTNVTINNISLKQLTQITPDKSGNNNVGELFTGKALEFDGDGDYVDVDGFQMTGTNATFAFWFNSNDTLGRFFDTVKDLSDNRLILSFNNNQISILDHTLSWFNFGSVTTNVWNRCVITIKGATAKCFVNGVQLGVDKTISTIDLSLNTDAAIGSHVFGTQSYFDGSLSDFQIYDKVWLNEDVTYDYANPQNLVTDRSGTSIALSNLKGYWHLSEGDGFVAYDSSGEGNNGTINGATYEPAQPRIPQLGMMNWAKITPVADEITLIPNPTIPTQDILGNAVRDRLNSFNLDGSGYSSVANNSSIKPTSALSIECWIKTPDVSSASKYISDADVGATRFFLMQVGSKARFKIATTEIDSAANLTDNTWHYIAGTWNGSTMTLYVDEETPVTISKSGAITYDTDDLFIGSRLGTGEYFDGLISDVRLYDRALTSDEVENNYNAGLSAHTN